MFAKTEPSSLRPVRVAFVLNSSGNQWMGGVNYMSNLLRAIATRHTLVPVIFGASPRIPDEFVRFETLEYIQTPLVDPSSIMWFARKSLTRLMCRDYLFERLMYQHRIDAVSHYGHLGLRARVPTIAWIPDFQHVRLPELFLPKEVTERNRMYRRMAKAATIVLLSSEVARQDFLDLYGMFESNTRVLRFVSDLGDTLHNIRSMAELSETYGVSRPYLHLPNQFWAHKNHAIVVEALALTLQKGHPVHVVATGHTRDDRNPGHFECLLARAEELGCGKNFKVLGLVPHTDLTSLMAHSAAIVNPSRFEGWSTTVEEAKSMGKRIILSDIPVHREQNPPYGTYFNPDDADALADAMIAHVKTAEGTTEPERKAKAKANLSARFAAFSETYEEIVREALLISNSP